MADADMEPIFGRLDALVDDVKPEQWWFDNAVCTIGRQPGVHVLIPREAVSRHHARIERTADGFVISDTGSANGTYVDGGRIADSWRLADCEEIGFGTPEPVLRFREFAAWEVAPVRPRYDEATHRFMLGGQPLELTDEEFQLLHVLWEHFKTVCDRPTCASAIWGPDHPTSLERTALDEAVNGLREKVRRVNPTGNPIARVPNGFILTG
jgi:hypothetical protein